MRFYARPSRRLVWQVAADVSVLAWVALWWAAGRVADATVRALVGPAQQTATTLDALRGQLLEAGARAADVPLVGAGLSRPFGDMAGELERLAASTQGIVGTLGLTAGLVGWLVFLGPSVPLLAAWLPRRLAFAARAREALELSASPEGLDLLALRALATRPAAELRAVASDPVAAWRSGDPAVTGRLAELQLAASGLGGTSLAPGLTAVPGSPDPDGPAGGSRCAAWRGRGVPAFRTRRRWRPSAHPRTPSRNCTPPTRPRRPSCRPDAPPTTPP